MPSDFDSAWKEAFEQFLLLLLELLFPDVVGEIDRTRGYESLEQEFRTLHPEGEGGKRFADKLIRVWTHSDDERILHVEAQAQRDDAFARRAFAYHYHADERFGIPPEALVILADDSPGWRPTKYEVALKRTKLTFEFAPVKLLDWCGKEDELRSHPNVMALFVLAHLEAMRTRGNDEERARAKVDLYRRLIDRKLETQDRYQWYRLLGWLLPLPEGLGQAVLRETQEYAKEDTMPFVTIEERYSLREGLLIGLKTALSIKFGAAGLALMPALDAIVPPEPLQAILEATTTAGTLDDIQKLLPTPPSGNGTSPQS